MQAFQDEMSAKAKARCHVNTRRARVDDTLSGPGAQRLAAVIRDFWSSAGFDAQTDIVRVGGASDAAPSYAIRSNLLNGLPRGAPANGGAGLSRMRLIGLRVVGAIQRQQLGRD
jgi:hypothetical protein